MCHIINKQKQQVTYINRQPDKQNRPTIYLVLLVMLQFAKRLFAANEADAN